jgi:hypothetical protein
VHDKPDVLELVARYAPAPAAIELEWTSARSREVLTAIVGDVDTEPARTAAAVALQAIPTHAGAAGRGWRRTLPIAASAAALLVALAGLTVMFRNSGATSGSAGGAAFDPPPGLSTSSIDDSEYSYRVLEQIDIDATGQAVPHGPNAMTIRDYVAPSGDVVSFRPGQEPPCFRFPQHGAGSIADPNRAFFAALPTDPEELRTYLRSHVSGSSSRDEAVFVAVGDMLREADGLASPQVRAAFVAVLSRTAGVTLHENTRDYLDRPAIRVDYVNQKTRPGEVNSLYFAPDTFQLLAEQSSTNGAPDTYAGPSPAYDATAPAGVDPEQLAGPGVVTVMASETVVTTVPTCTAG